MTGEEANYALVIYESSCNLHGTPQKILNLWSLDHTLRTVGMSDGILPYTKLLSTFFEMELWKDSMRFNFIFLFCSLDEWIKFDDDKVSIVTPEDILRLSGGGDWHIAYVLLYGPRRVEIMEEESE